MSRHDPEQLDLLTPIATVARSVGSIGDRFIAFHCANPHVFQNLRILALQAVRAGRHRVGIAQLFEVLRWEVAVATSGSEFKLDNSFRSLYARRLMDVDPELAGIFETRELRSA